MSEREGQRGGNSGRWEKEEGEYKGEGEGGGTPLWRGVVSIVQGGWKALPQTAARILHTRGFSRRLKRFVFALSSDIMASINIGLGSA